MDSVTLTKSSNHPHLTYVAVGHVDLAFSYETIIGFDSGDGWVTSVNLWSNTTARHLNELTGGPRLDRAEFVKRLDEALNFIDEEWKKHDGLE